MWWAALAALFVMFAGPVVPARAAGFEDVLSRELSVIFDQRLERAEAFVDWTYGWAASYVFSYKSAARVAVAVWETPEAGWRENILGTLNRFQQEAIAARVTQPEKSAAELSRLIDRYVAAKLIIRQSQALEEICSNQTREDCRAVVARELRALAHEVETQRLVSVVRAQESGEIAALVDIGDEDNVDLLHTARPITTRFITFALRLTELASVVVIVSQALRNAYVPDTAITRSIIALLVAWCLDYAVLGAESYFNKDSFLASIKTQVDAPRPAVEAYVRRQIAAAEAEFASRSADLGREFR